MWEISYTYYGWAIQAEDVLPLGVDENELNALLDLGFASEVLAVFTSPTHSNSAVHNFNAGTPWNSFEADISFDHTDRGSVTCYRLREGIERFMITDINNPAASAMAQSELPVMWDTVWTASKGEESYFNHIPGGGNVLYMDGHVTFVRYPGEWPVCRAYVAMMDTVSAAL